MPSPLLNIILRESLDPDAMEFCAVTGASDKRAISNFVKGVKYSLGIWNNIAMWPMIAGQNFGTGATARKLGGYTNVGNITLANGPTWTPPGVSKVGGTDILTFVVTTSVAEPWTMMVCETATAYNASLQSQVFCDSANNGAMHQTPSTPGTLFMYGTSGNNSNTTSSYLNLPVLYQMGRTTQYVLKKNNLASVVSSGGPFTFASGTARIGEGYSTRRYASVTHFAAFANVAVFTDGFYNLYKSTLGRSLALP